MLELLLDWKTIMSLSLSIGGLTFAVYRFMQLRKSKLEKRLSELEKTNAVQNEQIKDMSEEIGRLRDSIEKMVQNLIQWLRDNK